MKNKSPMEAAFSLAKDLEFDKATMRELEGLAFPKVEQLSPQQIKNIREKANFSQNLMAHCLNVSQSTYQKWERGEVIPKGGNLKLLNVALKQGIYRLMV